MTLLLTVPVPDGTPADRFLAQIVDGARGVLDDLALPSTGIEAEPGAFLTASGLPLISVPGGWGLADPVHQVVADLASNRGTLFGAAGVDPDTDLVGWLVRVLAASLGVGNVPDRDESETGEHWLARSLAATDDQPLQISMAPADVDRLADSVETTDLLMRQMIYTSLNVALPPVLAVDDECPEGQIRARLRDVRYPAYRFDGSPDLLSDAAVGYWAMVAATSLTALVSPTTIDAVLLQTRLWGQWTVKLAESRWDRPALTHLVRYRLQRYDGGPADLPLLVESVAMASTPTPDPDDDMAATLVAEFPGVATAFLEARGDQVRGIERLHQFRDAARSA